MSALGIDIGGANLKVAHTDAACLTVPFPLWSRSADLASELGKLLEQLPSAERIGVTMTGELADCFETKAQGVEQILDAVRSSTSSRSVKIWTTSGEFVDFELAREYPLLVASANWHALATWVGKLAPEGSCLLIDVGSTTTDLIPLLDGFPVPSGITDLERLQTGELEYTGVGRTPLSSIAHSVPFRKGQCSLAAELFATTLDLWLWTGQIDENPHDLETANGKPRTKTSTRDRLCRMLCADRTELSDDELRLICQFLQDVQQSRLNGCVDRICRAMESRCQSVIVSGSGEFLATRLARNHRLLRAAKLASLTEIISPEAASAACAFALSRLAEERM